MEQRAATIALVDRLPAVADLYRVSAAVNRGDDIRTAEQHDAETVILAAAVAAEAEDVLLAWVFDADRFRWWSRRCDDTQLLALLLRAADVARRHDQRYDTPRR